MYSLVGRTVGAIWCRTVGSISSSLSSLIPLSSSSSPHHIPILTAPAPDHSLVQLQADHDQDDEKERRKLCDSCHSSAGRRKRRKKSKSVTSTTAAASSTVVRGKRSLSSSKLTGLEDGKQRRKKQKTSQSGDQQQGQMTADVSSGATGVRTRSMIRMSAKQLSDLPDEMISVILSHLSLLQKVSASRVCTKFKTLIDDHLKRQTRIGVVSQQTFTCGLFHPCYSKLAASFDLNPDAEFFSNPECDHPDHRVSMSDMLSAKQLIRVTGRKLCKRLPNLRVIKFEDEIDGRNEMREAEAMLKSVRKSIQCFHFAALQLRSHSLSCPRLVHVCIHSMCVDKHHHHNNQNNHNNNQQQQLLHHHHQEEEELQQNHTPVPVKSAGILKSVQVLRCKEMCPKVFKKLPNGLISLKTDTHGRNFINFLLKSAACESLQVMKVTNFYSQSIDPFIIPNLRHLSIQGYFVHDTSTQFLRSLSGSTNLRFLKLQFFTEIRQNQFPQFIKISAEEWISFLSKLRNLESLEIWASLVNDAVVKCIVDRLGATPKSLVLHWSCLTDAGLAHLSDMRMLQTCKVLSEDNEISADAIIAFVEKQRIPGSLTCPSVKTKHSLMGQDERLQQALTNVQLNSCIKQIQVCCIRQQQTFRLF